MRIARITIAIGLGLLLAANGLLMLVDPGSWYAMVPGVPETGPLNAHFVRDIGAAYLVTGAAIAALAPDARAAPAALAGALFLTLHALVHVADAMAGRTHAEHVLAELASVFAPAVIALWLGHESVETTQMYLHADLRLKEQALSRVEPLGVKPSRYRPEDSLLRFLESL